MRRIGILTGGGDVPGLNAAVKALVWRLLDDPCDCEVIGLRRGWASLVNIIPERDADNSEWFTPLTRLNTRAIDRTGGTVLHTSRLNPAISRAEHIPAHLESEKGLPDERGRYDLTSAAMRVLNFLQLDALVALGGDGT
ncbi:MAG TPA: 6-phosphofructokinase, partial [Thermoanaerobaculia bacterium]|nr:6-phosphofructokinase [Thermoanaerobaculia bacterium]